MNGDDYLVSAALLAKGKDSSELVADLAARFERSMPTFVEVQRTGWGKRRKVKSLAINVEPERFRIEADHRGPRAWIDQIVRGICLKSEEVEVDRWLDRLATTLSREAAKSVEARLAIEDALR